MTKTDSMGKIEEVAAAINAVQLFSRFNDWTSDRVEGLPIEICRHAENETDIEIVQRFPAEVGEAEALALVVRRHRARAAIAALREPTDAMVEAGYDCPIIDYDGNDPREVWQTMIDKALEG